MDTSGNKPLAGTNPLFLETPREISRRSELWLVLILILMGGILRLATLGHESLWLDEGISVSASGFSLSYLWTVPFDVHPPLYFSILHVFRYLGESETLLRLPSALASTLALIPAYLLARALIGRAGAVATLLVLAGSYVNLTYAVTARNYALLLLLLLTAFATLHHVWSRYMAQPSAARHTLAWPALLYVMSAAGALYTHNIAVFYILLANAALAIHTLFARPASFLPVSLGLFVLNLPVVVAWLPWLAGIPGAAPDFSWLDQPGPADAVRTLFHVATPRAASPLAMLALLPVLITGVAAAALRRPAAFTILVFHLVALPVVIWLLGYVYKPVYIERTILPASFGAALAAGAAVAFLRPAIFSRSAIAVLVLVSAVSAAAFVTRWGVSHALSQQPVEDWRDALAAARKHDPDALVICRLIEVSVVRYYFPEARLWMPLDDGQITPLPDGVWEEVLGQPASTRPDMEAAILQAVDTHGLTPLTPDRFAEAHNRIGILSSDHCKYSPERQRSMLADYPAQLERTGFATLAPFRGENVWYQAFNRSGPAD